MYYGEKVNLREFREEDIEIAITHINNYNVAKMLTKQPILPIKQSDEEQSIRSRDTFSKDRIDFAIESIEEGKYIGNCSIVNIDYKNSNCSIGIKIGSDKDWGKGYGSDAIKVLVKFIFNELNISKVKLTVYEFNERAINTYEKIGFKSQGRLERELYRDGKYYDEILLALFKENYI